MRVERNRDEVGSRGALAESALVECCPGPLLVSPPRPWAAAREYLVDFLRCVERNLEQSGALLFRGFSIGGVEAFEALARELCGSLLSYDFASTPRTRLGGGVYSSTEYPAHQHIPLHSEQSYTRSWPMRILFYVKTPPAVNGETPIADMRRVYQGIDPAIRQRFDERGVLYVRNYGNGLDLSWQQVFGTEDRGAVEAFCRRNGIACDWRDGELRTRQVCQGVARHPGTGEWVWFNQAHLFHVSSLAPNVREALLDVVDVEDLPRNAYYGDGRPIEESVLEEVRGVLGREEIAFPWQAEDVLLLDNMLVAHGRRPYRGERTIAVAMGQPHSPSDDSSTGTVRPLR